MTAPLKRSMTLAELVTLPTVVSLDTANVALGLSRSRGYDLARTGDYPVRVLRVGRGYRVATTDLWQALGVPMPDLSPAAQEGSRSPA
ncbi:DNA-binding protein [Saccharothrix australiensis]|uniref:Helix-turn-helix protein n=1 Tax=Saccharothrix australiensis TaxID=2072 RepID=A0A495VLT7_9PSEU|nr:DNA-binding protein [Saccharothrix australiensis]RKT49285.1 hypothetical protein C8E97_6781 [Saccharothrix australiensis]